MTEKSGGDAVVGGRARISTQIYKRVLAETKLRELGMVWVVHKSHA
jgi:hypothetical protein